MGELAEMEGRKEKKKCVDDERKQEVEAEKGVVLLFICM